MQTPPSPAITSRDAALMTLIAAIWGVNNLAAKVLVDQFPPLMASALRFFFLSVVLIAFVKPPPGAWRTLALVGVLTGGVHFGIQSIGLHMAHDLSPMVIAMQLWIPASVAFSSLALGERAGAARIVGMAVSFGGIVLLVAEPSVFTQLGAFALVSIASVIYGGVAVIVRRSPAVHPLTFQAWIALGAWPFLFPASALFETGQIEAIRAGGWIPWAAIAWGVLASSVVANALMFALAQRYELARTTPYMFLTPVIAITLGVVFLHDPISAQFLTGCAVTMAGVALVALAERRFTSPRAAQ